MNDLLFTPLLMALIMGINPPHFMASNFAVAGIAAIHGAVPMFVHGFVPMPPRFLIHAGGRLGDKSVGERSNGGRSVGSPPVPGGIVFSSFGSGA